MEEYVKQFYQKGKKPIISELLMKNDSIGGLLSSIPQTQFTSRKVSKKHSENGIRQAGNSTRNLKKRIFESSNNNFANGFLFAQNSKDDIRNELFNIDFMKKKQSSKTKNN